MGSRIARISFGLFAALFAVAAALQFNDANSALWVGIYLAAAALCAAGAADRPPPLVLLGVFGLGCGIYAAVLAYAVATGDVTPMFEHSGAQPPGFFELEEGRELGGLLIIIAAVAGLAFDRANRGGS